MVPSVAFDEVGHFPLAVAKREARPGGRAGVGRAFHFAIAVPDALALGDPGQLAEITRLLRPLGKRLVLTLE